MYEEIIKSLRLCREILHEDDSCIEFVDGSCEAFPICAYQLMEKAADAIEELRKAVLRLEDESGIYDELPTFYIYPAKWIPVTERLPETDVDVLAFYEAKTPIEGRKITFICRASYIPKFTVLVEDKWSDFDGDWEDYCEENDSYYVPEGWYEETSQGNGDYYSWNINATVTHWMPLPEPPKEDK